MKMTQKSHFLLYPPGLTKFPVQLVKLKMHVAWPVAMLIERRSVENAQLQHSSFHNNFLLPIADQPSDRYTKAMEAPDLSVSEWSPAAKASLRDPDQHLRKVVH